jgi:diamine N-acetyltransferase
MDSPYLRKASAEDVLLLKNLCITTFVETFAESNSEENLNSFLSSTYSEDKLLKELKDQTSTIFFAYFNNEAVGYVKLGRAKKPPELKALKTIEVERIYVLKKMIGKKIGKLLIEACLDLSKKENYQALWLGVWEHNKPAITFYKKWGFDFFGSHIFMVGNDPQIDLLMVKKL